MDKHIYLGLSPQIPVTVANRDSPYLQYNDPRGDLLLGMGTTQNIPNIECFGISLKHICSIHGIVFTYIDLIRNSQPWTMHRPIFPVMECYQIH